MISFPSSQEQTIDIFQFVSFSPIHKINDESVYSQLNDVCTVR